MRIVVSFVLSAVAAMFFLANGFAIGGPLANAAECAEGAISPAADGTYSLCEGGQWVHVAQQLCLDYPNYAPNCVASSAPSSPAPAPVVPAPVVVPPPVDAPYVPVPSVPNVNVPSPNIGCTYVNGYTKRNGTHVNGYYRC